MTQDIYKKIVLGSVALGLVGGLIAVVAVFFFGLASVSARAPHGTVTTFALHNVFKASIARAAKSAPEPPNLDDPGLIALGAQHYGQVCSSCHGGPGLGQSPVALSMRPRPQSLPAVVDQFSDKELYEIIRNGVRFSAMPSWPADSNFNEIWSVVAFIRQLPEMSDETYVDLTRVDQSTADAIAWQSRGTSLDLTLHAMAPPIEEYLYASPSTGWRPIGIGDAPLAYCQACHGTDGSGDVTGGHAPNLTIQSSAFIAQRLRDYAMGTQASGIMATVASSLSEPQIDALANHFSSLPTVTLPDDQSDAANAEGQQIATHGISEEALPACASCHASDAVAANALIPAIAGQNRTFLASRLNEFKASSGTRGAIWNPMHAFARRISDEQIISLSAYLSALTEDTPLATAPLEQDVAVAEDYVTRVCATCHEATLNGAGGASIPNLTLQSESYIKWQLELFRSGQRESSQMRQTTQRMDDATIDALAAYIGGIPAIASNESVNWESADAEALVSAEELALNGDAERGIPSCSTCHGPAGDAVGLIPRIAGQEPDYIRHRLNTFAGIEDPDWVSNSPMRHIASQLTANERLGLADYFAGQPVAPKP